MGWGGGLICLVLKVGGSKISGFWVCGFFQTINSRESNGLHSIFKQHDHAL